jgi:acetyl coenzyme A synthetase (ADP forming)-like protein
MATKNKLDYFFTPQSVAVIGASRTPRKIGHVIFRNFIEGNYKGKLFPVNPSAEKLFGFNCYESVLKIKEKVDLAVIAIPAKFVPGALEQCGKKHIPAVIIITSGFKEIGETALENKLKQIAKKYGIRIIGTNCIGVYDPYTGVDTFFLPPYKLERPDAGDIAFISQSGALGSVVLDWMSMKDYRISKFISYGNATDVDESDLMEYLTGDSKTKVICAYIEGVTKGRKLFDIAKKYSRTKPMIAIKGGKTSEGTSAVSSHTGSLAGESRVYSAAFRQSGIIEARTLEQVFDFARTFATQPKPKGNRVQIITDGGGFGILTTDWVIKNKLRLAKMKKKNLKKIKDICPPYAIVKNPIDLTGDATSKRYAVAIQAAIEDQNVDMIALIILLQIPTLTAEIVDVVSELTRKSKKPIVVISSGGRFTEVLKKTMENNGVPCFSYPEKAAHALRALYEHSRSSVK